MRRRFHVGTLLTTALVVALFASVVFAGDDDYGVPPAGELGDLPVLPPLAVPAPPLQPFPAEALSPEDPPQPPASPEAPAPPADAGEEAKEEAVPAFPTPTADPAALCPPPPCLPWPYCCEIDPDPCVEPCEVPCDPCKPAEAPRLCRFRVILEGSYSFLNSPEGPFGLLAFTGNQMTWDGLDYRGEFGGRITLQSALSPLSHVELRAEYLGDWSDTARTTGAFAFAPPIPGIATANTAIMSSEATMLSGELNYWRRTRQTGRSSWQYGGGLRVISFNEEATANNFGVPFAPGFPTAPFVTSESENLFLGGQFGGAYHHQFSRCLEGSLGAKVLIGTIRRELTVRDSSIFAGGPHTAAASDEDSLTLGVELNADLTYRLSQRFALRAGYRLLVLDEVVRANAAMDFANSFSGAVQAQQVTDDLYVHSLFAGFVIDL